MLDYRMMFRRKSPTLLMLSVFFVFCLLCSIKGCSGKPEAEVPGKLRIVATTTMLSDLSSVIGGDNVEVAALMGPGIDPHLYQASAGDVEKMQKADIVVYNGLHLEGKMGKVFASLAEQGKKSICAADALDESRLIMDEAPPVPDPHIWFDISIWQDVARHLAAALSEADPENAASYAKNLENYLPQLEELKQYIDGRVAELPEYQRILVTAHDAFNYFSRAHKFQVVGLQGISTEAEASTAKIIEMADFIVEKKIKAIFIESSVSPKTIEVLQAGVVAKGFDIKIGGELYSDSLGDARSGHDSYITTLKANIDTIVDALL